MRILLINNSGEIRGGADKVFIELGKLLECKGHEVSYFTQSDSIESLPPFMSFKGMNWIGRLRHVSKYFYRKDVATNLLERIHVFKPDIIHMHLIYNGGLTSSVLKVVKKSSIPSMMTVHDYKLTCPVATHLTGSNKICESCLKYGAQMVLIRGCDQKSTGEENIFNRIVFMLEAFLRDFMYNPINIIDRFHFVSSFIKEKHILKSRYYEDKSFVLANFATENYSARIDIKKKYDLIYFGRLSAEKGILQLLDLLSFTNYSIVICGTGALSSAVRDISAKNKNVTYLGFRTGQELNNYIVQSKYSVLNSLWYENNPLSIIESMTLGVPCIAARIGGIPELISNGNDGFLYEAHNKDALLETVTQALEMNSKDYKRLSERAIESIQNKTNRDLFYSELIRQYCEVIR
jgi:glycosyltransferase involved in cell wall biosynthesis